MNIFESLENLSVSEECFNSILSLIEANIEDSPLHKACNGEPYPTREEHLAYIKQLEQDKKDYDKKQAALKRKQNKKPKFTYNSPGQQKLF